MWLVEWDKCETLSIDKSTPCIVGKFMSHVKATHRIVPNGKHWDTQQRQKTDMHEKKRDIKLDHLWLCSGSLDLKRKNIGDHRSSHALGHSGRCNGWIDMGWMEMDCHACFRKLWDREDIVWMEHMTGHDMSQMWSRRGRWKTCIPMQSPHQQRRQS